MKNKLSLVLFFFIALGSSQAQGLPENPEPGKCYVKCITKDEFKKVEDTNIVYPAYTKLEIVPATYKTVEDKVLVKEATKKYVYVPATYESVEVAYVKKAGRTDLNIVPASFGKDANTYIFYPKTSGWEYKQMDDCPSVNKTGCVTACFVEYPEQTKKFSFTTLVKDAATTPVPVEKKDASYTKRVIKTPARMDEIEIPAEYATITRMVVDVPASTKSVTVPAKYETIERTVLTKKGGITTWEEVACELLSPTVLPIFYELANARLTPESKKVIERTLMPILTSSNVNIALMSHTDSRGNDAYNLSLSQQRANSVVNYLVSKGISKSRLSSKGYGETRLTNNCSNGVKCTEAQHQKNRRTEFRIINN